MPFTLEDRSRVREAGFDLDLYRLTTGRALIALLLKFPTLRRQGAIIRTPHKDILTLRGNTTTVTFEVWTTGLADIEVKADCGNEFIGSWDPSRPAGQEWRIEQSKDDHSRD